MIQCDHNRSDCGHNNRKKNMLSFKRNSTCCCGVDRLRIFNAINKNNKNKQRHFSMRTILNIFLIWLQLWWIDDRFLIIEFRICEFNYVPITMWIFLWFFFFHSVFQRLSVCDRFCNAKNKTSVCCGLDDSQTKGEWLEKKKQKEKTKKHIRLISSKEKNIYDKII